MTKKVPVSLADPSVPVENATTWIELNNLAKGNPQFAVVEIKAFYAIGLIDDICQSVDWLLKSQDAWPNKYLPAFALFASGVDLLGRCLTGNKTPDLEANLAIGFHYLAQPNPQPPAKNISTKDQEEMIVAKTEFFEYTVADLVALRHFAAHGQATTKKKLRGIDLELMDTFPKLVGNAMETYWRGLQKDDEYCRRLGDAKFDPLSGREYPLKHILEYFSMPGNSAGSLFYRFDWRVVK